MATFPRTEPQIVSEITLTDHTRATDFEYRVIAINKAGQGQPGNTVMAVL
jgi:hypothetical protein